MVIILDNLMLGVSAFKKSVCVCVGGGGRQLSPPGDYGYPHFFFFCV